MSAPPSAAASELSQPSELSHGPPLERRFAAIRLFGIDIDGCLTDGLLYWAGPEIGWTQRYAVRDGEAIVRLRDSAIQVVPISRNKTACARARMQHLGLPLEWVGVSDKMAALSQVAEKYRVAPSAMAYLGDGQEDVPILSAVQLACAPADGHPKARAVAHYVTQAQGGRGVAEEIIDRLLARPPTDAPTTGALGPRGARAP